MAFPAITVDFPAAFPTGAKPLRGGDGEAWRIWLDGYLDDVTLAKVAAIARSQVRLKVTLEVMENGD